MMASVTHCVLKRFLMNNRKRIGLQYTADLQAQLQMQVRTNSNATAPGVKERTLVAIKPDGVQRHLIGQIIKRFEQRGFHLVGLKMVQATEELLAQHYAALHKKPFYPSILQYMTSGPVVVMVWEGHNVIKSTRMLVGDTNPATAAPGTLRGDFSVHVSRNVVHASDSLEMAQKEISLWFQSAELIDWMSCDHDNMYES